MTDPLTDRELVRALGRPRGLAADLGVPRTRIYEWQKTGRIPAVWRPAVAFLCIQRGVAMPAEIATHEPIAKAAMAAGLTARDLAPPPA